MSRSWRAVLTMALVTFGLAAVPAMPAAAATAATCGSPCIVPFHHSAVRVHTGTTVVLVADPGVCPQVQSDNPAVLAAAGTYVHGLASGCAFKALKTGVANVYDVIHPPCPIPPGAPPPTCGPVRDVLLHVVVVPTPKHHHPHKH